MSDIPDSGSFNSNLASIASQNYGPNAVANQNLTAAQTGLTQQQTQGAAIQNANARLQFQLFRQGMAHLTDFSGQDGPTLGAGLNDSSGVTAASASPTAGAPPTGASGVSPEDDIGQSAADQARLQAAIESKYNVDPAGTRAEQIAILQAHQYAVQMKLSGNKGLADVSERKWAALGPLLRPSIIVLAANALAVLSPIVTLHDPTLVHSNRVKILRMPDVDHTSGKAADYGSVFTV